MNAPERTSVGAASAAMQRSQALPLAGIRIADFTWIGAGSFTTKLLADFGADVIKVESAERLDTLREGAPFKDGIPGVNRSGYFADRNSSKRSITVNLKRPQGQALVKRLVAQSDVVANNFTPGTMEKFGLGYEAVREIRPDIVYLAMSMQGATGPECNYLGYGATIGALTGLQHLCGLPELDPAGTGTNYPDHVPNPTHAAFAVLAALRHRRRTGEGQCIDMAQSEPTIALLGPAVLEWTANGRVAQRRGNQHLACAPHGVYPCAGADRWIAIAVTSDAAWDSVIEVLDRPAWMLDAALRDAAARFERRAEIDAKLAESTRRHEAVPLMQAPQARGVAAGAVRDVADLMQRDPQLRHRGHWVQLDHPEMGPSIYNAPAFRMSGLEPVPRVPAPLLGQHTDEVLRDLLAMSDADIAALREDGVLR